MSKEDKTMLKQYTLRMPGAVFGGEDSLDKLTNLVEDSAKVAVVHR